MTTQELSQKDQTQFSKLVKFYDSKQYRLGLAQCKKILANNPVHGETISMKALIMNATGKPEEAMSLAKEGLKNNFKSATCWHVVGILESRSRNYEKALNAYKMAIKMEPKNFIVLRDLSCMQHILRKYEDYRQTRLDVIPLKPSQNMSWIGFALANHFNRDTDLATAVLKNFKATLESQNSKFENHTYDVSEIMIFCAQMLYIDGSYSKCLMLMKEHDAKMVDPIQKHEIYTNLYLKLGRPGPAEKHATWLIRRNQEHLGYYKALEQIIKPDGTEAKLVLYSVICENYPRALTPKRIPLDFLSADHPEFEIRVNEYLRTGIKKGRPALFQDIKPLYEVHGKAVIIEKVMAEIAADEKLNPGCFPWTCYFMSKHYTLTGDFVKALDYCKRGLDHTPTLVELYVAKAKILKKSGNLKGAVEAIDEAQAMDTADRYTNCIACKYLLQNGEIKRAEEMLGKFVRESTNVVDYLRELQVLWFEIEAAKICYATKNYAEALRRCQLIKRIYSDMFEDQFDFLQYCLRRTTMVSFSEFISLQDVLNSHKIYEQASFIASQIYLKMNENRSLVSESENPPLIKIEVTVPKEVKVEKDEGWGPKKETPLVAAECIKAENPLEEMASFVVALEKHQPGAMLSHTPKICDLPSCENSVKVMSECQTPMAYALSIQLNETKGKTCQALRSLHKGVQVLKATSLKNSKRVNSSNGYFIGVATKFLKNFDKTADETVTALFENMDLPSVDELRKYLNLNSLQAMLDSDLDFEANELVGDHVVCDFRTVKEAQLKFPQWTDVFDKMIMKKFPTFE